VAPEQRIFSGIQPTGRKHLGNYIGAILQYVEGQDRGESIYCVVDLHALTMPYDPRLLRQYLYDTTAILIAAGLDPERCILFRQSDVVEHTELTWHLGTLTPWGDLNRMPQWMEKRALLEKRPGAFVGSGIFNYPILMAADVLVYRANDVPVGDDQRQHVELMREVARRFNERFGETLVVPEHRIPEVGARIMDLQAPTSRMSTTASSDQGAVYILDEPAAIRKKFASAVTDSGSEVVRGADKAGITNMIEIAAVARGVTPEQIEAEFAGSGYGDFKKAAAESVVELLNPVRERFEELRPDEAMLERTLAAGAEKARGIAADTLADVREAMGVGPPR
jgi:tryptophanyl-tRNA synthetase